MRPDWFPDWSGQVCAVIASGPSVDRETVEKLKGRCRVAVVNNGFEIAPWADLLYVADARWWDHYRAAHKFEGLKVSPDAATAKRLGLKLIDLLGQVDGDKDVFVIDRPGVIARGGNGAFQAVNLVTQFGAMRQIWIGFDFCGEHWHGKHPEPLKNPRPQTLDKWRKRLEAQAPVLAELGVEVANASMISTLTAYPKIDALAALDRWAA